MAKPNSLDYYEILQVSPKAEAEVIQAAYRRLALKYHPDSNSLSGSNEKMKLLNKAYAVLSNPDLRRAYDLQLSCTSFPEHKATEKKQASGFQASRRLIYRSDFYESSGEWYEGSVSGEYKAFRRNGYYHLVVMRSFYSRFSWVKLPTSDFEVCVEAQLAKNSGNHSSYGVEFRLNDVGAYRFSISRFGHYALALREEMNEQWTTLLDWRFSEFLNHDDTVNSLRVTMVGKRIQLGANGQILTRFDDDSLQSGSAGLFVATASDETFAEARFRDFRLYSINSG